MEINSYAASKICASDWHVSSAAYAVLSGEIYIAERRLYLLRLWLTGEQCLVRQGCQKETRTLIQMLNFTPIGAS